MLMGGNRFLSLFTPCPIPLFSPSIVLCFFPLKVTKLLSPPFLFQIQFSAAATLRFSLLRGGFIVLPTLPPNKPHSSPTETLREITLNIYFRDDCSRRYDDKHHYVMYIKRTSARTTTKLRRKRYAPTPNPPPSM